MSDSFLWTRFKAGSTDAFSRIYCTYHHDLIRYGCHLNPDADLVKDLIQDLFLDLWTRRRNLGDVLSVRYYLFKCLKRRIAKAILRTDSKGLDCDFVRVEPPEEVLFRDDANAVDAAHLQQTLFKLTRRQREAIYLRFYNNLDTKGIATAMALSAKGAANLISKGIVALRSDFKNP